MKLKQKLIVLLLCLGMTVALTACFNFGVQDETPTECDHVFGNWFTVIDPTCSAGGMERHNCTVDGCDYYETRETEVDPGAHKLTGSGEAKAPTCYSVGWKAYKICSECGFNDYIEIPVLPHTFVDGVCSVCDFNESHAELSFTLSEDGTYYIITGADGYTGTNLSLPTTYRKLPVKAVGNYAFAACETLECVYIPTSITEVADGAFYGCTALGRVVIENTDSTVGLRSIGESAFEGCTALSVVSLSTDADTAVGVTIPDAITKIGAAAFRGCTAMDSIKLPGSLVAVNDSLVEGCTAITSISIPVTVTEIGVSAFKNCSELSEIVFLDGVSGDNGNTTIIRNKVASIGASAFVGCNNLVSITLPDALTSIGRSAFEGCEALCEVNLGTLSKLSEISPYAFKDCYAITSFTFTSYVSEIGIYAFENTSIESVILPVSLNSVGLGAFAGCDDIHSMVTPFVGEKADGTGATHFGYIFGATTYAQNGNKVPAELNKVIVNDADSIAAYAFAGCSGISDISVNDNVVSIGESAFDGVNSSVFTVSGGLCYIGSVENPYLALVKPATSSQNSYEVNNDTVLICDGAFKNCANLESLSFAEAVEQPAADDESAVTETVIPASLKYIGAGAFEGCINLYRFVLTENLKAVGDGAFDGCRKLVEICNKSALKVSAGSSDYGSVAAAALYVYSLEEDENGNVIDSTRIGVSDDGFVFYIIPTVEGGEKHLIGYTGDKSEIVIPGDVVCILPYALADTSLVSIKLGDPAKIYEVGFAAFAGCESLVSLEVPFVGDGAENAHFGYVFGAESYLENEELVPESLVNVTVRGGEHVADFAFFGCNSLVAVDFTGDALVKSETVTDEDGVITTVEVIEKNMLLSIGISAFEDCTALTSITIPGKVESIGEYAFAGCTALQAINFADTDTLTITTVVTPAGEETDAEPTTTVDNSHTYGAPVLSELGTSAFEGCTALVGITIPGGVAVINENTFNGCTSLVYVGFGEKTIFVETEYEPKEELIEATETEAAKLQITEQTQHDTITTSAGVEIISANAFYGCTALAEIVIPGTVIEIGESAFAGCTALASVEFTDKIVKVNSATTWVVTTKKLDGTVVDSNTTVIPHTVDKPAVSSPALVAIKESAFAGCTVLAEIEITSNVSELGASAFEGAGLKRLDFAENISLTVIGAAAFKNCQLMTSLDLPVGVTMISESAFEGCTNLIRVSVSKTIGEIRADAFAGCTKLEIVIVDEDCPIKIVKGSVAHGKIALYAKEVIANVELTPDIDGDDNGFVVIEKDGLKILYTYIGHDTEIVIPAGIHEIRSGAFTNCDAVSLIIPASVEKIGLGAFSGCTLLETVKIAYVGGEGGTNFGYIFGAETYRDNPNYVPATIKTVIIDGGSIAANAFADCHNIETVVMGSSVTSVGKAAFRNLEKLRTVTVSGTIAEDAFYGCESLNHVTVLNTVDSIGANAFRDCYRLVEVHNASELSIVAGDDVNHGSIGCYALDVTDISDSKINVSDGFVTYVDGDKVILVDYIGDATEIKIPDNVTEINSYALYGRDNLVAVEIPATVNFIGVNALTGCDSIEKLTVPFIGDGASVTHFGYLFGAADSAKNASCVPASLAELSVIGNLNVADSAFAGCASLKAVAFLDGVSGIGVSAFEGCTALADIDLIADVAVLNNSGVQIGDKAFFGCVSLCEIAIPANVSSIGASAFSGCEKLTSVIFDVENSVLDSIGANAFESTALTALSLPASLASIGASAFSGCAKLASVDIADNSSLATIGDEAFLGCSALETVNLGENSALASIGNSAFSGCTALAAISLPAGLVTISSEAFNGCAALSAVTVPATVTTIGNSAFEGCTGVKVFAVEKGSVLTNVGTEILGGCSAVTDITVPFVGDGVNNEYLGYLFGAKAYSANASMIPETLVSVTVNGDTAIAANTFYGCKSIVYVTLSDSITSIGASAFEGCTKLYTVNLPDTLVTVGNNAFKGCSSVDGITLSGCVTSIGASAFEGCSALSAIKVPNSVTSIGSSAFKGCSSAQTITIGSGIKVLPESAFENCYAVTSVEIPSTVVYILNNAFAGCSALESVTLSVGVKSILAGAFADTAISSLIVPATVEEIGFGAFDGCDSLAEITVPYLGSKAQATNNYFFGYIFGASSAEENVLFVPASLKSVTVTGGTVKAYAFVGCTGIETITLPETLTAIGEGAFEGCSALVSAVIPETVTEIGAYTFSDCTSISDVVLPEKLATIGVGAFKGTAIASIVIPDGITAIADETFADCDKLTTVIFGENSQVTEICDEAFSGCSALTTLALPETVTEIGADAFLSCPDAFFVIPESGGYYLPVGNADDGASRLVLVKAVTHTNTFEIDENTVIIASGAFDGCITVTNITVPEGVEYINDGAFASCLKLVEVCNKSELDITAGSDSHGSVAAQALRVYTDGESGIVYNPNGMVVYIDDSGNMILVGYNGRAAAITIPEEITGIYAYAFAGYGLVSIEIPDTVKTIGYGAFTGCDGLTKIVLPYVGNGVEAGTLAHLFGDVAPVALEDVTVKGGVIAEGAFAGYTTIKNVIITDGVTAISADALAGCSALESLTVPTLAGHIGYLFGATSANNNADFVPASLKTVTVKGGVIAEYAFYGTSVEKFDLDGVTSVGFGAFESCDALKSITVPAVESHIGVFFGALSYKDNGKVVPASLTEVIITASDAIADNAFAGCAYIENVEIPDGVVTIGNSAFEGCSALKSITIPGTVESIGDRAFADCAALSSVIFADLETIVSENVVVDTETEETVKTTVTVVCGSAVTYIGTEAFRNCSSLLSVVIPGGVEDISDMTFAGCTALEQVVFGGTHVTTITTVDKSTDGKEYTNVSKNAVTESYASVLNTIGVAAFEGCSSVTAINVPGTVTEIQERAFAGCSALVSVVFDDIVIVDTSKTETTDDTDPDNIITTVVITETTDKYTGSLSYIGKSAFEGCSSLASIAIPGGVSEICESAFKDCSALAEVTFDSFVVSNEVNVKKSVNDEAFAEVKDECTSVKTEYYPEISYIGASAFENCVALTAVVIPNGVTAIGDRAFAGCSALASVIFADRAFVSVSEQVSEELAEDGETPVTVTVRVTETLTVTSYLESIGASAFEGCALTEIIIPGGVTEIGEAAFKNCTSIKSLVFGDVNATTDIIVEKSVDGIEYSVEQDLCKTETITAPSVLETIGASAFENCALIEKLTVPATVKTIGDRAFAGCTSISELVFAQNVATSTTEETETRVSETDPDVSAQVVRKTVVTVSADSLLETIGAGAFEGCAMIKSVVIPGKVTAVGDGAFKDCTALNSVVFAKYSVTTNTEVLESVDGSDFAEIADECDTEITSSDAVVDYIGESAFENCGALTAVEIPYSVYTIGASAFKNCISLKSVVFTDKVVSTSDTVKTESADETDPDKTIVTETKTTTTVTESSRVEYIGDSAFEGCIALAEITVPGGVTYVGKSAFKNCISMKSAVFADAYVITDVVVEKSVDGSEFAVVADSCITAVDETPAAAVTVGFGAFEGCEALVSVTLPFIGGGFVEPELDDNGEEIEVQTSHFGYVFGAETANDNASCVPASLKTVIILGGDEVADSAFAGCYGIESITLPNTITSIGEYAFADCSAIDRIVVPAGVQSIGFGAFEGCNSLVSIVLPFVGGGDIVIDAPETDEDIENAEDAEEEEISTTHFGYIFGAYSAEENAWFVPETLRGVIITNACEIGERAFLNCAYIASVKYPDGTVVADDAFEGCDRLNSAEDKDVTVDDNGFVTETDGDVVTLVEYTGNEKSIIIPEGITHIGEYVFAGMNITDVTLSSTVVSIGAYAFDSCTALKSVTLTEAVTSIAKGAFEGCDALEYTDDENGGFYLGFEDNPYFALVKVDLNLGTYTTHANTVIICDSALEGCGITAVVITSAVTVIGKDVFANCASLASITLPYSITDIGEGAFDGCDALVYTEDDYAYYLGNNINKYLVLVKAKDTVKAIYEINDDTQIIARNAFAGLKNMVKIKLSANVKTICDGAFEGCVNLIEIQNKSSYIEITAGSLDNGGIGYYAENIYAADEASKVAVDKNGFVIYEGSVLLGYIGAETEIAIPAGITEIHARAFYNSDIVSVVLPQGVTVIGESAFEGCENLTSVTVAQSVVTIGNRAFADCIALSEIVFAEYKQIDGEGDDQVVNVLTSALTTIGEYAFTNTALTTITIPDGVTVISLGAFEGCICLESFYVGENSSLEVIGESAFAGCEMLSVIDIVAENKDVTEKFVGIAIPAGVTEIGKSAFEGCYSIAAVKFAESVAVISERAFADCYGLTELVIPETVTSIGLGAFAGCDSLESITVPYVGDGADNSYFGYIFGAEKYEDNGIYTPAFLTTVTVSGGEITDNCFYGCSGITNITITAKIDKIGAGAFENCSAMESFKTPATVTSIGFAAFRGCESLTELTAPMIDADGASTYLGYLFGAESYKKNAKFVPASLTTVNVMGDKDIVFGAFYGCKYLEQVVFDEDTALTAIASEAFYGCSGLTSIVIPDSVTEIGIRAFWGCDSLTEMTVPFVGGSRTENTYFGYIFGAASYESNGGYVPEYLETVTVTDITVIPEYAFYGCYGIRNVYFAEDLVLNEIGANAFEGCEALETISVPLYVAKIGDAAFKNCVSLAEVKISSISQLVSIGNEAFSGCVSLMSFDIPKGVTVIGVGAFAGCESLAGVNFKNTAGWKTFDETIGEYVDVDINALATAESAAVALTENYVENTLER